MNKKYYIDDANSLVYTEEEDIINDNFHINGNIIYFEGHFYDDIDFNKTKYLLMKNNLEEKSINKGIIIDSNNINEIIVQKEIINKYNNNQTHFFPNTPKNKNNYKNIKNQLGYKNDFLTSTEIICNNDDIISFLKLKRKKNVFIFHKKRI